MFHHQRSTYIVYLSFGSLSVRKIPDTGLSECAKFPIRSVLFTFTDDNGEEIEIEKFKCIPTETEPYTEQGDAKITCWAQYSEFYFLSFNLEYRSLYGDWQFAATDFVKHQYLPDMKDVEHFVIDRFVIVDTLIVNQCRICFIKLPRSAT